MSQTPKLAACLLNISSSCPTVVRPVVDACVAEGWIEGKLRATVIKVLQDNVYNRSAITVAGNITSLESSIVAAASQAIQLIDMEQHVGGHPRLGAVDLVPVHPIAEETSLADCSELVKSIAEKVVAQHPRAAFFFYGDADGEKRGLIERRREVGWFGSSVVHGMVPDCGQLSHRTGLTGAGAVPYMGVYNVTIQTKDRSVGIKVLRAIREKEGGLLGVSAVALPHQGRLEVACNVDLVKIDARIDRHREAMEGGEIERGWRDWWRTKASVIGDVVEKVAMEEGVEVVEGSVIKGLTPIEARDLIIQAMKQQRQWTW